MFLSLFCAFHVRFRMTGFVKRLSEKSCCEDVTFINYVFLKKIRCIYIHTLFYAIKRRVGTKIVWGPVIVSYTIFFFQRQRWTKTCPNLWFVSEYFLWVKLITETKGPITWRISVWAKILAGRWAGNLCDYMVNFSPGWQPMPPSSYTHFLWANLSKRGRGNEVNPIWSTNPWNKARPLHRELRALLFYDKCVGSLMSLADHIALKMQEAGPTIYRPYPRRLEHLTICILSHWKQINAQMHFYTQVTSFFSLGWNFILIT